MSMSIEENLMGELSMEIIYTDDDPYSQTTSLQAEHIESKKYKIALIENEQTFDCALTDTLSCMWEENPEFVYVFIKNTEKE